jgi:hypothetical protein
LKTLVINTHLTYPGWSEGRLNRTFMDAAKAFFVERGHHVTETFVEHGYTPDDEVQKHAAADLVILQTPVNWFGAPWIYKMTLLLHSLYLAGTLTINWPCAFVSIRSVGKSRRAGPSVTWPVGSNVEP